MRKWLCTKTFFQVLQGGFQDSEKKCIKRKGKNEERTQIKYFLYHTANKYEIYSLLNLKSQNSVST